jgi:hypothetical protein
MRARSRHGLLAVACLLGMLPAALPAVEETIVAPFDLVGWRQLGALTIQAPPLGSGDLEALLDGDPRTGVLAPDRSAGTFRLGFSEAQVVNGVRLRAGGDWPAVLGLVIVEEDGARFQAGQAEVSGGQEIAFRLRDVPATELIVSVESAEEGRGVALADVIVVGPQVIQALSVEDVPETLTVGGSFPYRVRGRDELGGRPDLTSLCRLVVVPSRALTFAEDQRAVTRVQGPLTIHARYDSLSSLPQPLLVTPLGPAPPPPRPRPGLHTVCLELEGQPPFEVLRRDVGQKIELSLGRTESGWFYDDDIQPGTGYVYRTRRIDSFDNARSELSGEARVRTLSRLEPGTSDPGRVPVLVAIFVDSLLPEEVTPVRESLQAAARFVYRHSLGRIVLDLSFIEVPGPTPPTAGPTMLGIEARLRQMGVRDDQFGLVFAVAGDLAGEFGPFEMLGRTLGAMGRGQPVPTPDQALGPDPGVAAAFVHELQHVLVRLMAQIEDAALVPSGHFQEDFGESGVLGGWRGRPFDAGEDWDGHAWLLTSLEGWSRVGPPWKRPLEIRDSDGDGLGDDDARLPIDERRLGSDPRSPDSDGDGLNDLDELAAGLYQGGDPTNADTDGDGLIDGVDPWPLSDFTGMIPRGTEPQRLASRPDPLAAGQASIEFEACWTSQTLTLVVLTAEPRDVFVDLDGSGELGRWESDVNLGDASQPSSDVWAGAARIALRVHQQPTGVFVGGRELAEAQVRCLHTTEGAHRLTAVLPRNLGPGATDVWVPPDAPLGTGLRLATGRVLGLALTLRPPRVGDPAPFDPYPQDADWTSLFETHRLMDAELRDG